MIVRMKSLILLSTLCMLMVSNPASAQVEQAHELINKGQAMLDRFQMFTCEYDCGETSVLDLKDVSERKYTKTPRVGKYTWSKSAKKEALFVVEDEETTRVLNSPPKKAKAFAGNKNLLMGEAVPFMTTKLLGTDDNSLAYNPRINVAGVYNTPLEKLSVDLPLFCQCKGTNTTGNFTCHILKIIQDKNVKVGVSEITEGGKSYIKIQAENVPNYKSIEAWLDPTRGHMLVKARLVATDSTETTTYMEILETKEYGDKRWFPTRKFQAIRQKQMNKWNIKDYTITRLIADQEPPSSSFEVELPAGTFVRAGEQPNDLIRLRKNEIVHVNQLSDLHKRVMAESKMP